MLTLQKNRSVFLAPRIETLPYPCRFGNYLRDVLAAQAQRLQISDKEVAFQLRA